MPKTRLLLALSIVACRPPAANLDIGLVVEVRPARPGHGETRLALGDDHSCAIEGETLVCWGADNPIAGAGVKPAVGPTFAEGIEDIESGARGVCVLLGGGRVDCLGRPTPVGVENAVDLAVGDHHGCVVLAEGAVACWGSNDLAQLGVGDRVDHALVPGTVVQNSMRSAVMVAAGKDHTCAVDRSGGLWCWGGSPRSSGLEGVSPEHVHEIARVERVAAGDGGLVCVRTAEREVYCFDWEPGRAVRPRRIEGLLQPTELFAAGRTACARQERGDVRCWGRNLRGVLGDGTWRDRDEAAPVLELGQVEDFALAGDHACARRSNGEILCWGDNSRRELGLEIGETQHETPVEVVGIEGAVDIAAGWSHTCVRASDGRVSCFGDNDHGQLGHVPGVNEPRWQGRPLAWEKGGDRIEVGARSSCARTGTKLVCHGFVGALPGGAGHDELALRLWPAIEGAIAQDGAWGCSRRENGQVRCFGTLPWQDCIPDLQRCTPVVSGPTRIKEIVASSLSVGHAHACGLGEAGEVFCFGTNAFGQLGRAGFRSSRATAVRVDGLPPASRVEAGWSETCVIGDDLRVWCFGSERDEAEDAHRPRAVEGTEGATELALGPTHACAVIGKYGRVVCWGDNRFGQLGRGTTGPALRREPPQEVEGLTDVSRIAAGMGHTCAVARGKVHCWGNNAHGQLGTGITPALQRPAKVEGLPSRPESATETGAGTESSATDSGETGEPPREG